MGPAVSFIGVLLFPFFFFLCVQFALFLLCFPGPLGGGRPIGELLPSIEVPACLFYIS